MKTSPEQRDKLKILTAGFARIHKLLFEQQMNELEVAQGAEIKPATRLNLLLNDPAFAWLRSLSQLMAIADDVYFQKESITPEQMQNIHKASVDLFINRNNTEFAKHYEIAAQKSTSIMIEQAQLAKIIKDF